MTLLDIDIANPKVVAADSLRMEAEDILQRMTTDPTSFWHDLGQSALEFGLKVLAALVIYLVGIWVIRRIKKVLARVFERRNTERTLATFLSSFVSISLTVILIIITVGTLGVNTTSLAALLAAGGMAIGMALSGTVQNFAGGIMLLIFKPFKAGDYIEAQGIEGRVIDVSITSTKILPNDNRLVVLPNGALSNGTIVNHFAQPLRRITWSISVAYGADAEKMRSLILGMLAEDKRILTSADKRPQADSQVAVNLSDVPIPNPSVNLESLNANDITFVVRAWVNSKDYWDVLYQYNERFYAELPQEGFSFAYPHMDVTIVK